MSLGCRVELRRCIAVDALKVHCRAWAVTSLPRACTPGLPPAGTHGRRDRLGPLALRTSRFGRGHGVPVSRCERTDGLAELPRRDAGNVQLPHPPRNHAVGMMTLLASRPTMWIDQIEIAVSLALERFRGARVREFVTLLAERDARRRLRALQLHRVTSTEPEVRNRAG
jgi:hypothetical protein